MKKKTLFGILFLLIAICLFIGWKVAGPATSTRSGEFFYIHTGSDYATVKKQLQEQHFINGSTWFDLVAKVVGFKTPRAGRYKIPKGTSILKLVRMLRNGQQTPVSFVITKIRTREQLAGKIGKSFETDSLQAIRFLSNNDSLKAYDLDSNTVMSAAMPFTYTIKWNTGMKDIFKSFFTAYKNFWTPERQTKTDSLHLSRTEIITLASIIEEETNKKADKYNIASTYLNRLKKGMMLQADPTVKFAMKNFALKRVEGIHLRTNSPYNTYQNKGLPPGPICTPSVETIEAVLDAPATDYLYFVASSAFDGSSIFTSDYEEHMKYARLYQKELTRRMDSARQAKQ